MIQNSAVHNLIRIGIEFFPVANLKLKGIKTPCLSTSAKSTKESCSVKNLVRIITPW